MYNDIVEIYDQIFPLNKSFLDFIPPYLGDPGARVLDLGCGPGHYVDELSQREYQTTGIDNSAAMIQYAVDHFQGEFHALSFTEIGQLEGSFDCVFSIGNSLSYLPLDFMPPFCRDVSNLLNQSGYFVIQVVNWDKFQLSEDFDFPVKTLAEGLTFHRRYVPAKNKRVLFETELRKDGQLLHAWADPLYPKYAADLQTCVKNAGMSIIDLLGDYDKTPFDPQSSPATILIARK